MLSYKSNAELQNGCLFDLFWCDKFCCSFFTSFVGILSCSGGKVEMRLRNLEDSKEFGVRPVNSNWDKRTLLCSETKGRQQVGGCTTIWVQKLSHRGDENRNFDGTSTDLQEYLSHFELLAKWNGWSRVEKDIQLAMSPRGAAQQVLGRNCEAEDYESLTAILKKWFHPKERVPLYRYEFRNRRKRKRNLSPTLVAIWSF